MIYVKKQSIKLYNMTNKIHLNSLKQSKTAKIAIIY